MEPQSQNLKTAPFLTLGRFHINEDYGFLLPNPLRELPGHYSPWMEIANRLPQLIESHQLRAQVNEALNGAVIPPELVRIFKIVSQPIFRATCGIRYKVEDRERLPLADRRGRSLIRSFCEAMPLLNCQFLTGYREWRLARLVLSFITMGYVWQDGETQPKQILPRNLALPFVEVSRNLGLPPILVHADLVLANWVTRNPGGPLEIRNLDTIVLFPGGESLRSFILVNVVVEKAAVPGIKALVQAVNAILQPSSDSLLQALQRLRVSIQDITRALGQIHDYVDPDIFYAVIRIFLSGWENNPALPVGLVYEGVSKDPLSYAGGSAAQSTILHSFDEFLGVRHSKKSAEFLRRMRNYMPPSHRAFIEEIRLAPSLRTHVLSSGNSQLLTAYNQCVESLAALRTYHLTLVTKYLIVAASKAKAQRTSHLPRPPQALEKRGTGGTAIMSFLKDVRDKTLEALLHPSG